MKSHRMTLDKKPAFKQLSEDIQNGILKVIDLECRNVSSDLILEIGAGVIPLSSLSCHTISSDVEASDGLDCIASAMALPLKNSSVRAVVAQNVFHHIPNHNLAMQEFSRVLADGGLVILVEPYFGWFASLIYPALFSSEGYDKRLGLNEAITDEYGRTLPNQAISYQYFLAGKLGEIESYPSMEVIAAEPLPSGLRYLLSGALNFRKVAPNLVLKLLRSIEDIKGIRTILNTFAIHWLVIIKEKPKNS